MDEFHNHIDERNEMKEVRCNRIHKNKQNIFIYVEFKNKKIPSTCGINCENGGYCQERGRTVMGKVMKLRGGFLYSWECLIS